MTPQRKSILALGGTLVLGVVLGLLIAGAIGQWRAGRLAGMREPEGFVRHMEDIIRPIDDAQRNAIRPILEETGRANGRLLREADDGLRDELRRMIDRLEEHLRPEQLERLRRFERHPPPGGPGGPGEPGAPPGHQR